MVEQDRHPTQCGYVTTALTREREFAQLRDRLRPVPDGAGAVVFLSGATGSGKSSLLRSLREEAEGSPDLDRLEVIDVTCYESGTVNPLAPFGEVLRALTEADRRRTTARRAVEIISEVAPPLVELIPVIGKYAAGAIRAGSALGAYSLGGNPQAEQLQLASDVTSSLLRIARRESPLLIVIDDAHWLDAASSEVVNRVAAKATTEPIMLLLAYDPHYVSDGDTFARMRSTALACFGVHSLSLPRLDVDALERLVQERFGRPLHRNLPRLLSELCQGNLLFTDQYLQGLVEQGVIRLEGNRWTLDGGIEGPPGDWRLTGALGDAPTPSALVDVLRPRVANLERDERRLLESGAVQGR